MTPSITDWIVAITTIVYTLGTLALWHATRQSLEAMRSAYKLQLLQEYFAALDKGDPGPGNEVFARVHAKAMGSRRLELLRKVFGDELADFEKT